MREAVQQLGELRARLECTRRWLALPPRNLRLELAHEGRAHSQVAARRMHLARSRTGAGAGAGLGLGLRFGLRLGAWGYTRVRVKRRRGRTILWKGIFSLLSDCSAAAASIFCR